MMKCIMQEMNMNNFNFYQGHYGDTRRNKLRMSFNKFIPINGYTGTEEDLEAFTHIQITEIILYNTGFKANKIFVKCNLCDGNIFEIDISNSTITSQIKKRSHDKFELIRTSDKIVLSFHDEHDKPINLAQSDICININLCD